MGSVLTWTNNLSHIRAYCNLKAAEAFQQNIAAFVLSKMYNEQCEKSKGLELQRNQFSQFAWLHI